MSLGVDFRPAKDLFPPLSRDGAVWHDGADRRPQLSRQQTPVLVRRRLRWRFGIDLSLTVVTVHILLVVAAVPGGIGGDSTADSFANWAEVHVS